MKIGKLPNSVLHELILSQIKIKNPDVLVSPSVGEDCSAISFGDECCVLTTDPITGTDKNIGRLAVHITCNDIASSGATPLGLMVNILAPSGTSAEDLAHISSEINETAAALGVDVIGGHTEITHAVNRFVVVSTGIGKILSSKLVTTSKAQPNDYLILTKTPGLEGTAIIAQEKENELVEKFGTSFVEQSKQFIDHISVLKEGIICGEIGVNAMHDITEGGLLGAVWEMSEASKCGVEIYSDAIPLAYQTSEICNYYGIHPLKLISSGSMLISTPDHIKVIEALHKNNIQSTVIGKMTESKDKKLFLDATEFELIGEPNSDELYKVVQ